VDITMKISAPIVENYVYAGFADTPDQVPDAVRGRIALASRGSTVDLGIVPSAFSMPALPFEISTSRRSSAR